MKPSCDHHTKENGDEERERIPTASIAAPVAIVVAEKPVGEKHKKNCDLNEAVNCKTDYEFDEIGQGGGPCL
ncbi:hypothetical protein FKF73_01500 [Aeromonas hydrophila]|nr:hypothetical protein [Aeromonas hydrophila]